MNARCHPNGTHMPCITCREERQRLEAKITQLESEIRTEHTGSLRDVVCLIGSGVERVDRVDDSDQTGVELVNLPAKTHVARLQHGIGLVERGLKIITDSTHAISVGGER